MTTAQDSNEDKPTERIQQRNALSGQLASVSQQHNQLSRQSMQQPKIIQSGASSTSNL